MGVAKGQEVWEWPGARQYGCSQGSGSMGVARGQAVVKGRQRSGSIRNDVMGPVVSTQFQGCNKSLVGIRDVARGEAVCSKVALSDSYSQNLSTLGWPVGRI
jgi:hypothetical protein